MRSGERGAIWGPEDGVRHGWICNLALRKIELKNSIRILHLKGLYIICRYIVAYTMTKADP